MNIGADGSIYKRQNLFMVFVLLWLVGALMPAMALNLTVSGDDGTGVLTPVTNYRWLIEEDDTKHIIPGVTCLNGVGVPGGTPGTTGNDCLSTTFHQSYMNAVAKGTSADPFPTLDPAKRYFISVLPDQGNANVNGGVDYSNGGAEIELGQTDVNITVNALPLQTAQIRVFVFNDNHPVNNQPDTPAEQGLAGFNILLEDGGGRYGIAAGHQTKDVFGNPIGTTYNPDGTVLAMGDGTVTTDANGIAVIKNLQPGKYGITVTRPAGTDWVQTATIEGTHIIDAWVKENEPPFFTEFGPPGPHVFVGFTRPFSDAKLSGGATVSGQIRVIHNSRPPNFEFYTGWPVPDCWVALNEVAIAGGKGLYVGKCNPDSTFSIPNVPPGDYQLAIWDGPLDMIFATHNITVTADANGNAQDLNLLDVPVFAWFQRLEQSTFLDLNENGIHDAGELPLFEQATNIRWRDGTIYQSVPTDLSGEAPYDEVFPFFSWLIAEVDYARFKATGATITVDAGGPLVPGQATNPQPQSENAGGPNRTELGPVLTQAFQGFMGQTNVIEWGKKPYAPGENGGISGIVYYSVTRAEDDPRYAAAEPWEPGIPRMQIALYQDTDFDGVIDDRNGDGCPTPADVDNYPFGMTPGSEDFVYKLDTAPGAPACHFVRDPAGLAFSLGDAIQTTTTDSWDDNLPTGCQSSNPEEIFSVDGDPALTLDCYDGLRAFNQVRPGVFDGGYAFAGVTTQNPAGIPAGNYIVGVGEHPVYEIVKEEDRNVDFGNTYVPSTAALPPVCVGNDHLVPNTFSLFDAGTAPLNAGLQTPTCDLKQIYLADGQNAAVDFFEFTEVPVAAHVVGFILDDASNEFDPNSPNFGEKYSPPFMPISIRDWTGREIGRTYSDRWGSYNALVPSTYTVNVPSPSGVSPSMLTLCMNDPGPVKDSTGALVTDPFFRRQYSQFCYTLDFMPGVATYLDTPVVPIAAFAGPDQFPLDCEFPDGTPVIWSTQGSTINGPYVAQAGDQMTIVSAGNTVVPNPDFGLPGQPRTITRDFGFGATMGTVTINGIPLTTTGTNPEVISWDNNSITIKVPRSGQLDIIRGDNNVSTVTGITVTVGGGVMVVNPAGKIQDAIDVANAGDLIIVPPGHYEELVIMWKPVRLQGSGASTVIDAVKAPAEKLLKWRNDIQALVTSGAVNLLPAQEVGFGLPEPATLNTEEGPGIIVLGNRKSGTRRGAFGRTRSGPNARIDGIGFTGGDTGGGIFVNGYAHYLQITNNRVYSNHGVFGGGIRIGHPMLTKTDANGNLVYESGQNDHIVINHNYIAANGATSGGVGGGLSINHGTDRYQVTQNYICGNYTNGHGGGIGAFGNNDFGLIEDNTIIFNQSFNQGAPVSGGGIAIVGAPDPAPVNPGLGSGAGNVKIISNLIQGNNAGAGDGAGIVLSGINGEDIRSAGITDWNRVDIENNIIVNNIAGLAGGGIALKDAALVHMINNTIANNDSTATAGLAFPAGSPNISVNQPAGVVSYAHSAALDAAMPATRRLRAYHNFSNPTMINNIIWHNRTFHFEIDQISAPAVYGLVPDIGTGGLPQYDDLGVLGYAGSLNPLNSILTDTTGTDASNISLDPAFVQGYFNGDAGQTIQQLETTTSITVQPAFDEGGNFIDIRFGPHQPAGDYHLQSTSPAIDGGNGAVLGSYPELANDIDNDPRPLGVTVDIGADEAQ